jgi:NADH:ubiquinone oxidoreductase subunit F (NADH-binding)
MKIETSRDLNKLKGAGEKLLRPDTLRVQVGASSSAFSKEAAQAGEQLKKELGKRGIETVVVSVGCLGLSTQEPIVEVIAPGKPKVTYGRITAGVAPLLAGAIAEGKVLKKYALYRTDEEELLCSAAGFSYGTASAEFKGLPTAGEFKFLKPQVRIAMRNSGQIDPESIEEYAARGGFAALHKALTTMTPEQVIATVIKSELRGKGGGGFPAGQKWQSCRDATGNDKYVICNCSEGDPGIGMHKSLIESDPYSIIEGLAIGGYAIGAREGYIYLHHGYAAGRHKLKKAIDRAAESGLLGENIFGSGFSFTVTLKEGAGAYVCGESTALMACLEGRAGEPRPKYIHTAEKGLWDKPTNLNNVETWCNIAPIIFRGPEWFAKIGTKASRGTKVISLTGNISTPCLAEVPMGTTLKTVITKLGGGVPKGSTLKGIGIGGPPAGVLPASLADTPIEFDALWKAGSMLGSGGMIVMDDKNCMVDMTRFFLKFLEEESCGRCFPCREGVKRMRELVEGISIGVGKPEHLALLEELAECLSQTALCDLGKSAPNAVRCALRHFKEEFDTHIEREICPAKRCTM